MRDRIQAMGIKEVVTAPRSPRQRKAHVACEPPGLRPVQRSMEFTVRDEIIDKVGKGN